MAQEVTDPAILKAFEEQERKQGRVVTDPALIKAFQEQEKAAQPNVGEDVLRSGAAGLGRGTLEMAGAPADLGAGANSAVDWALKKLTGHSQEELARGGNPLFQNVISPETLKKYGSENLIHNATTGENSNLPAMPFLGYQPRTGAGRLTHNIAEQVPNMAFGPGRMGTNFLTMAALPGAGATAGEALAPSIGMSPETGKAIGTFAGALSPAGMKVITPHAARPERLELAKILKEERVPITAGQKTGDMKLQRLENQRPSEHIANIKEAQEYAYTHAANRRMGENGEVLANPQVLNENKDRIVGTINDLSAKHSIDFNSPQPYVEMLDTMLQSKNLMEPHRRDTVANLMNELFHDVNPTTGHMPGDVYQARRSMITKMAHDANKGNDTKYAEFLRNIRNKLDDLMERNIAAKSPEDLGRWQQARREYGNMKVIANATAGAAKNGRAGYVTPTQLYRAGSSEGAGVGKDATAFGRGDFNDLTRAGDHIIGAMPADSGTAANLRASGQMPTWSKKIAGLLAGSTAGSAIGSTVIPAAGALLPYLGAATIGSMAPDAWRAYKLSAIGQKHMGNQVFSREAIKGGIKHADRSTLVQALRAAAGR